MRRNESLLFCSDVLTVGAFIASLQYRDRRLRKENSGLENGLDPMIPVTHPHVGELNSALRNKSKLNNFLSQTRSKCRWCENKSPSSHGR